MYLAQIVTASGEKQKLLGETNVMLTIGGVSEYHLIVVAQHVTQECQYWTLICIHPTSIPLFLTL